MNDFVANLGLLRPFSRHFASVRFLCRFLCLLCFAGFLSAGTAPAAQVAIAPSASVGPDLSFSVADFDGDSRPDLASVQAGRSDSLRTNYWIQLQLSATGRQTFRIVAPVGGLAIVSRDVNGDHAPDLVLTTAWLDQPVAILLNDGHGNFSQVEPAAFPEAFSECKTSWNSPSDRAIGAVGIPPQLRDDICSQAELVSYLRTQSLFAAASDSRFTFACFLISHLGRAPPREVFHS
jgi:hypothetical protein